MNKIVCVLVLISACGGAQSPTTTPESGGVPSPPRPWAELDHEARAAWMSDEVVPRMSELFASYDRERFADFSCINCHGPSPQQRQFQMPSPALPALYPTGSDEQRRMMDEYGEGCRFMFSHVLPTMQTLLGAAPYDAETHAGFSCYSCHPHAGDEGVTPIRLAEPTAPE